MLCGCRNTTATAGVCGVMAPGVTVRTAAELTTEPNELVTTTVYAPALPAWTLAMP